MDSDVNRFRRPGLARMLYEFVFPHYCKVCDRRLDPQEEQLCITCFLSLPRLDYDMNGLNPAERLLLTERSLERAASVLQYSKESDYRLILFHLKYWHHPRVGEWLARLGAKSLFDKGFFDGIDAIVPVPLSFMKELKRGYNQCMYIAKGVQSVTGIPILKEAVKRSPERHHQAGLGKYQRWVNAGGRFTVADAQALRGKHILIVDDVITTGATLCSMIDTIQEAVPDIRVSVFTLGLAT